MAAAPIGPDVTAAVDALIAKKDLIHKAGLASETADALNLCSYDHNTLSLEGVAPKLDNSTISMAIPSVLQIDKDWRRGVEAFGGKPLPPLDLGGPSMSA